MESLSAQINSTQNGNEIKFNPKYEVTSNEAFRDNFFNIILLSLFYIEREMFNLEIFSLLTDNVF